MAVAELIDGRAHAASLRDVVRRESRLFAEQAGRPPHLEVVLVGEHPASLSYVGTKTRMAAEVGQTARLRRLPADTTTATLLALIASLNADPGVDGILVQLPLPRQITAEAVLETIDVVKDVDGFHPANVGRLATSRAPLADDLLIPCTPLGCMLMLRATLGDDGLAGRRAVVVGRSSIVGKPMAALLLAADP
jgi:methylenetetrahydrofolate dehydrogenase (NADP+)/methenyltetrahydrofolate cyclohydrolase